MLMRKNVNNDVRKYWPIFNSLLSVLSSYETLRLMLDILHITYLANIDYCGYNCQIKKPVEINNFLCGFMLVSNEACLFNSRSCLGYQSTAGISHGIFILRRESLVRSTMPNFL